MQIEFTYEDQINENLNSHMTRLDTLANIEDGLMLKNKLTSEQQNDLSNGVLLRNFLLKENIGTLFSLSRLKDNKIIITSNKDSDYNITLNFNLKL